MQGILHPPQWKCKATSDLANGTIPEYPTPFFIESGAPVVLNRLTFFSQCKVPKICPFARLRVALHFFHTHTQQQPPRTDLTRLAALVLCAVASVHCRVQQRAIDDSCGAGLNPSITSSLYYPWNRIVNYWWCCACDCDWWGREGSSCSSSRNMVRSRLCLLPSSFPSFPETSLFHLSSYSYLPLPLYFILSSSFYLFLQG